MPIPSGRFSQLRLLQTVVCVTATLGAVALIILGLTGLGPASAVRGIWLVVAGGCVLFIVVLAMMFMPLMLKIESTLARQLSELRDFNEAVGKQTAVLESISENTRISDAAKSLAHRQQELDSLRAAIRDDLRNERWEVTLNLVEEMERRFGCKEEADQLREEVDDARHQAIEAKLREAIEMIDSHFAAHDWERAEGEIERLRHALPDHSKVMALQDRMVAKKEAHKQELLATWNEAVGRSDTDRAIDILRELDQYLSPAEAQSLQSSARDVFKNKLLQMGVQFRFAVTGKRWQDALDTGLELIREFPNSRMSNEVREVLDTLRERARAEAESPTESEVSPS
ncbi:MAG: hypothetical protein ACE5EX_00540 [Phycisphaerae bacterium]